MQLSKIIKNLKPHYRSHFFSNLSSNSKECKKDDIFFQLKDKGTTVINLLKMQLAEVRELLFQIQSQRD